ncbi:Arc family DNA-binding protein [Pseudomonas mosselii]|uniref:Arc family DNA-binding protein n=1 Tax=Pseudomonas mosselii TaxID=78327 RepID=UPI0021D96307|nr:Arc family DNA-binding protein [Pseudomonas mosselii]MCU9529354.1 Arc family DNA-binding protein [Pseudomonas mosselii]MCU9536645.1 Arc family DNA-binding protein [Pseudomonas mosselii]MCU9542265.1 Arc family DNA-binding protein [Pseudomonas mosselii]MCU9548370.1 Arc family DNA-binding protein [Pseudomonas mosselii]
MRPSNHQVYSSRTADKFVVRLPEGMREKIGEVAKVRHRSMNSEIIARLEESLANENDDSKIQVYSDSLSTSEKLMLSAFRKLATSQQKALVDLISAKPVSKESEQVSESKAA